MFFITLLVLLEFQMSIIHFKRNDTIQNKLLKKDYLRI